MDWLQFASFAMQMVRGVYSRLIQAARPFALTSVFEWERLCISFTSSVQAVKEN
jgi:hypothetical protein